MCVGWIFHEVTSSHINSNHLCATRGFYCTCTSSWILLTKTLNFLGGNHEIDGTFFLNYRGGRQDVQLQTEVSAELEQGTWGLL